MVMNITVDAILILTVYVPLQYIHTYFSSILSYQNSSHKSLFVAVQTVLISVSAMSLLTLKAQHHMKAAISSFALSTLWQSVFCALAVWLMSFSVAAFTYTFNVYPKIGHVLVPLVHVVLYIVVLPTAMTMFRHNIKDISKHSEDENLITFTVITELSKVFGLTHVPLLFGSYSDSVVSLSDWLVLIIHTLKLCSFTYIFLIRVLTQWHCVEEVVRSGNSCMGACSDVGTG
jgi:hypothetical protein